MGRSYYYWVPCLQKLGKISCNTLKIKASSKKLSLASYHQKINLVNTAPDTNAHLERFLNMFKMEWLAMIIVIVLQTSTGKKYKLYAQIHITTGKQVEATVKVGFMSQSKSSVIFLQALSIVTCKSLTYSEVTACD